MTTATGYPELLTLRELATYLRISMRTAYQLVYDGAVPAVKVGGQWRVPRSELIAWLAAAKTGTRDGP